MNTPAKKPARSRVSPDRPAAKAGKSSSEKKLLQRLRKKVKNANAKKSATEKSEKKAIKKLLAAEKKFEKANINKIKAEAVVKRLADSRKLAGEKFEAAKADYDACKDSPVATAKPVTSSRTNPEKPGVAKKKTAPKKAVLKKTTAKKAAPKKAVPKKTTAKKAAPRKAAPKAPPVTTTQNAAAENTKTENPVTADKNSA